MKISGENPVSGKVFNTELNIVDSSFLESMSFFDTTDEKARKIIEGLDISADAKQMLFSFSKVTIRAGEQIVKIGRKILDYIYRLLSEFPSVTFGVIFGAIAGFLISSIPFLGVILGPIFTPIAIAFGLLSGLREDIKDKELSRKIAEINAKFNPLNV